MYALQVLGVEGVLYALGMFNPGLGDMVLADGRRISWLRYCGWLMTCPVLLMFLVSMTTYGGRRATVRLVPLLISNQTMILAGVTACAYGAPTKWGIYMVAITMGGIVLTLSFMCLPMSETAPSKAWWPTLPPSSG